MSVDKIPIGTFSRITGLSKKALYCYEKKGLLEPSERNLCTGYRSYTPAQIERGIWIQRLGSLGFSLDEIQVILAAPDRNNNPLVRRLIAGKRASVRREMERLAMVERVLSAVDPFMEVFSVALKNWTIKKIPALRVMAIRGKGPYGEVIADLFGQLCAEIFSPENVANGVKAIGPIGTIYVGEDCDETGGLIEAVLPVAGNVTVSNPAIGIRTLPETSVVSVVHKGPYRDLGMAHQKIYAYLEEHHCAMAGPPRELYLNDPAETPEGDLLTEIQYPVTG